MTIEHLLSLDDINDDIEKALFIALQAHSEQRDKSGEMYILHVMRVAVKMHTNQGRIVALLHDVVEDTNVTIEDIQNIFDEEIANAIYAITHKPNEPNALYIKRVKANPLATAVKIQDLRDNMSWQRMAMLPSADVERLLKKYTKAYAALQGVY